jgi:hypothetical protein
MTVARELPRFAKECCPDLGMEYRDRYVSRAGHSTTLDIATASGARRCVLSTVIVAQCRALECGTVAHRGRGRAGGTLRIRIAEQRFTWITQ